MSKRFTDTDKFKKHFHRNLPGPYKLLWDYLYHACDHAGIWHVDFEIAQINIGKDMPVEESKALELFNADEERIKILPGGKKWWIIPFIPFQYDCLPESLNLGNRLHKSVSEILIKHGLISKGLASPLLAPSKPLASPLLGAKDKDKDKVKDKDKDKDSIKKDGGAGGRKKKAAEEFVLPLWIPPDAWAAFEEMRRSIRKPMTNRARELIATKLENFMKQGQDVRAILEQSIESSWQRVFPLNGKGGGKTRNEPRTFAEIRDEYDQEKYSAALEQLASGIHNRGGPVS